jgi:hypothetical protein
MQQQRKAVLAEAIARQIAVKASVSPRTVQKAAAGFPIRGLAGYRVRAALRAVGLLPSPPDAAPTSGAES